MTTLTTRSAKGSELSHSELDANFKRTVSQKTTTYSCLVSDNRSVIECVHATVPFTVTLGDAATMAVADTGDYEVTIANIGAAAVTVARAGSDTIDGVATSIVLQQYSSVTLKVNVAGDGYNSVARGLGDLTSTVAELNLNDGAVLRHKVIDIGDWNMDLASGPSGIAHGLDRTKIRGISVVIRDDNDNLLYQFPRPYVLSTSGAEGAAITSTTVNLVRATGGNFDSNAFDSTSYNRGWITIWYVD